MQKQEQEATRDLKNTLVAPDLENLKFRIHSGVIFSHFEGQNRCKIASNFDSKIERPKQKKKGPPKGAPAIIDPCTSGPQGSLGGRGESIIKQNKPI